MFTMAEKIWDDRLAGVSKSIRWADSIAICGHKGPDGDCLGSLLSLGLGLRSLGKRVYMLCSEEIPQRYHCLPGINLLQRGTEKQVDLAIAVDCGSKEMLDDSDGVFDYASTIVEIDHHHCRSSFADISYVDSLASCAAEQVFYLLDELGVGINEPIARNILTAIIVETNSFRIPGLRSETFEVCAQLLNTGVNFSDIAESVYWIRSRETEILGGICLSKCRFASRGRLAWSALTRKDLFKAGAKDFHADPVIEKIRSIQGVDLAVLFREKRERQLKVSFRSKGGLDVSVLAEAFGGGGHLSAAGCTLEDNRKNRSSVIRASARFLDNYSNNSDKNNLAASSLSLNSPTGKSPANNYSIYNFSGYDTENSTAPLNATAVAEPFSFPKIETLLSEPKLNR